MKNIIGKIFPKNLNNDYNGSKIAFYVFIGLTLITLWRSQHHLFSPDGGAQSIATIPLNLFTSDGAQTVIGIFALWGLSQLIIGFLYVIVCVKYRNMIPLMYLFMIFEYFMRMVYIPLYKPIVTLDTPPGARGNFPFLFISIILFVLSLIENKKMKS